MPAVRLRGEAAGRKMSSRTCANAPWYTAPVIVGGSGGSGTRGVALLLEALGVAMACMTPDFLMLQQNESATNHDLGMNKQRHSSHRRCDLKCNSAADCGVISSFRTGKGVGGHGALSWLRHNGSNHRAPAIHADSGSSYDGALTAASANGMHHYPSHRDPGCVIHSEAALEDALNKPTEVCGGSKRAAMAKLRELVAPRHRKPLRWGLKNPHATYYVNVLRRIFPCLVYINTVRDLSVMVRTAKHFESRVQEAVRYGVYSEASMKSHMSSVVSQQRFYGSFLRRVNGGLHRWLTRCMPYRFAHVPLQRLVVLGGPEAQGGGGGGDARANAHGACFDSVMGPLFRALRIEATTETINTTRQFLLKSLPTVTKSLAEAAQRPLSLPAGDDAIRWPAILDHEACQGEIMPSVST